MPDAAARFADHLRVAAGCITASRLLARPTGRHGGTEWTIGFATPAPIRASGPLAGATISVRMTAAVVGELANVTSYQIAFRDRLDAELLAWHWQPGPDFAGPDHPHMHVSAALRPSLAAGERAVVPIDKVHLPTGLVPLSAIVRALVEEFGVQPLTIDWRERLGGEPS